MNQIVTLTAVEEKATGTNKRGPWKLRIFRAAGGTAFQTFDVDLGDKAIGLLNQESYIEYEEEVNGNFTNNVLKSVRPATGSAATTSVSSSVNATPTSILVPTSSQDEFRRSKEEMRRTESVKAAATILASPNWDVEKSPITIETLGLLTEKIAALIESGAPAHDDVRF